MRKDWAPVLPSAEKLNKHNLFRMHFSKKFQIKLDYFSNERLTLK